ncbi:MAG TPA: hypothetical protein ENJ19_04885 [Gammaproteobacteria bacterium]|nr:hypothetical protein [Gammaproteobacteria bacterium]
MKMGMMVFLAAVMGGALFGVQAQAEDGAQASRPVIAAQFETRSIQLARRPQASRHRWHLLRSVRQVEVWNEGEAQRQRWQRRANGVIDYSHLFLQPRKSVDYTAGDLRSLGRYPDWMQLRGVIDSAVLRQLTPSGNVEVLGRQAERYLGQVNGVDMEIWWLSDLELPALVRRVHGDREVSIHLLDLQTGGAASQSFVDTGSYDHLDYADLGDMEADPFVQKLQLAEGGHRHH